MQIETNNLQSVANYAKAKKISRVYTYQQAKSKKIPSVNIDGTLFIDITNVNLQSQAKPKKTLQSLTPKTGFKLVGGKVQKNP